ncbi:MAG: hypothetical protein Q8R98_08690, partial [Rubrivivax sp.]|nr:hypothetical protein [Rubrivivax sp.]
SLLIEAQTLHERLTGGGNDESIGLVVRLALVCALRGDGEAALNHLALADALADSQSEADVQVHNRLATRALAHATAGQIALALAAAAAMQSPPAALSPQAGVRVLRSRAMALRKSGDVAAAEAVAAQALLVAAQSTCSALERGLAWVEAARCSAALGMPVQARQHFHAALAAWAAGQVDGPLMLRPVQLEIEALPKT